MLKNRRNKKYAVTTIAASAAVASVAPVATAAEEAPPFSDMDMINEDHAEAVHSLVESEVIGGFKDGTFKPTAAIERLHVAKMLVRALDLETPSNPEEVVSVYTDIDPDKLAAADIEAIAAVTKAELIEGVNDEFLPNEPTSRQQMASMLARAYSFNEYTEGLDDVEVDLTTVSEEHRANVQALANLEVTKETPDFRAYESVPRQQFATFIYRAMDVVDDAEETEDVIAATEATEDFEALVDSVEKVGALVEDKDAQNETSTEFVKASNKIQQVTGDVKDELMSRLDAAQDIVIATSHVNSLQEKTSELIEDTISDAKIKLTSAKGSVDSLPDGDIKDALHALIQTEADKIDAFEAPKEVDPSTITASSTVDLEGDFTIALEDEEEVTGTVASEENDANDFETIITFDNVEVDGTETAFDIAELGDTFEMTLNEETYTVQKDGDAWTIQTAEETAAVKDLNAKITETLEGSSSDLLDITFDAEKNNAVITITKPDQSIFDISGTGLIAAFFAQDEIEKIKIGDGDVIDITDMSMQDLKVLIGATMITEMQSKGESWSTLGDLVGKEVAFTLYGTTKDDVEFEASYRFNFQ